VKQEELNGGTNKTAVAITPAWGLKGASGCSGAVVQQDKNSNETTAQCQAQ